MKIIKFIGTIVLSFLSGYIIWLLFLFSIPFIFQLSWFYSILIYLFGYSVLVALFSIIPLIATPAFFFTKSNKTAGSIGLLFLLIHVYSTVKMIWTFCPEYHAKEVISSLVLTSLALPLFLSLIQIVLGFNHNKEEL